MKSGNYPIEFGKTFNEFLNSENLNNSANSILNTVTQLNEINGIKILINGEENKNFKDTIYLEKNN